MKPGRNDPCPCGSGKKYKQCCANAQTGVVQAPRIDVPQTVQAAVEAHRAGQLQHAMMLYRQVLQADPRNYDALHMLGVAAYQTKQLDAAADLIGQALLLKPSLARAHLNLGNVLKDQGRLDEAAASYRRVVALEPKLADAHLLLGDVLVLQEQWEQSTASYRRAIALDPAYAQAHHNLGSVLQARGRRDEALPCFERAAALRPDYPDAWYMLGIALKDVGRIEEASVSFRRETANNPSHAGAYNNLGNALLLLGRAEEATNALLRAIEIDPELADAHYNLGNALEVQLRLEEAVASYRRALALRQDYKARNNLGNVLKEQGWLDEAADSYRQACALRPEATEPHSNLLLCLNYPGGPDDAGLYAAHREFDARHAQPLAAEIQPHGNRRDPIRPLRIGYVSADFKRHPVGYFFEPVLAAHDQTQVEAYCYSNTSQPDEITARLQAKAAVWRNIAALDDAALANLIREDGIDILVDLSGHTGGNRLPAFARKPAPIQVGWLGYFNTSGLDAMDYAIWDAASLPEEAERWFTEKIVRMPDSRFCYLPPDYAPPVAPLPALKRGGAITFGSFNNIAKVSPAVVSLWANLLHAVPRSRLLLKWKSLGDGTVRQRYLQLFADHGIGADRLELRGETPHQQMLAEYGDVDIALDPFPYSGGLTSCEALWMGVPVVTLAGTRPVSRQTLGYLTLVNLAELAATTPEQYVQVAADLASDIDRLADLRAGLRDTMAASPLCDGPRFARNLEQRYRDMWEEWCANPGSTKTEQRSAGAITRA